MISKQFIIILIALTVLIPVGAFSDTEPPFPPTTCEPCKKEGVPAEEPGGTPWKGPQDPTWNPQGPGNGSWGSSSTGSFSDPFNLMQGWGSAGYYQMNPPMWARIAMMGGVLTDNYSYIIHQMRTKSAWANDDVLADQIIYDYALWAGKAGLAASAFTQLVQFVKPEILEPGSWGGTIGTGLTIGTEALYVMSVQMQMTLTLMELYGQLPDNINQRINQMADPFIISTAAGSVSRLTQGAVKNLIEKRLTEKLLGQMAQNAITTQVTGELGAKAAGALLEQGVQKAVEEAGAQVVAQSSAQQATKLGAVFARLAPALSVVVASGIGFGFDYCTTKAYGQMTKEWLRAARTQTTASMMDTLKADPHAKKVLWLLLTKNIFPLMSNTDPVRGTKLAQQYELIIQSQFPLIKNDRFDERDDLFKAYQKQDPKAQNMIDTYLLDMGKRLELQPEAKLYFMKLLMAGMLMKGEISDLDAQTLKTVAIELRLRPPDNIELKDLSRNDPRLANNDRYEQQFSYLEKQALQEGRASKPVTLNYYDGRSETFLDLPNSGQLIAEEFAQVSDVSKALEEARRQGTLSSKDVASAKGITKKLWDATRFTFNASTCW